MEIMIGRPVNIAGTLLRSFSILRTVKSLSGLGCSCQCDYKKWNTSFYATKSHQHRLVSRCLLPLSNSLESVSYEKRIGLNNKELLATFCNKVDTEQTDKKVNIKPGHESTLKNPKLNIFQKMKQLFKDYWHIAIPVHIATSIVWVSIFYVAANNNVDIVSLMNWLHLPEKYMEIVKKTGAGHWVIVWAMYKIFTPLRYTVTVGGTMMSIKYLDKTGYYKFRIPTQKAKPSTKSNNAPKETNSTSASKYDEQQKKD